MFIKKLDKIDSSYYFFTAVFKTKIKTLWGQDLALIFTSTPGRKNKTEEVTL